MASDRFESRANFHRVHFSVRQHGPPGLVLVVTSALIAALAVVMVSVGDWGIGLLDGVPCAKLALDTVDGRLVVPQLEVTADEQASIVEAIRSAAALGVDRQGDGAREIPSPQPSTRSPTIARSYRASASASPGLR